jgi:hypothetical protein
MANYKKNPNQFGLNEYKDTLLTENRLKRLADEPRSFTLLTLKTCAKCGNRQPKKGGKGGFGKPFICKQCITAGSPPCAH